MELLKELDKRSNSDDIAYMHNEQCMTYRTLLHKANRLAYYIQSTLKDDKTPIPVYGHKDALMLVVFLACVKSGRAYCPIDTGVPLSRVKAILETVNSPMVFALEDLDLDIPALLYKEEVEEIIEKQSQDIDECCYVKPQDTYYIIFTSGSTGIPKGVQIAYANLNHFLQWSMEIANAKDQKKIFMNQAPFSFDLSVMDVYTALASGGTIYAIDKATAKDYRMLFQALQESDINVWVSTPSFADMCLIDKSFTQAMMPKLDTFLFCGEVLTNETARKLLERFPGVRLINTYGPTESTVAVSEVRINEEIVASCNPLPIGKAKPNTKLCIMNTDGTLLSDHEKGEIIIAGDTVGIGYYRNEEQTQKAFFTIELDGKTYPAYHTGDKGYMIDGMLYYSGRMDLQVKLNGYRIEIADIEQNLLKVEHVENAVVLPQYKHGKISHLVGVIVYKGDTTKRFATGQQISSSLKQYVPDYMVPKKYVFLNEMPMTNNGKADRKALQEVIS